MARSSFNPQAAHLIELQDLLTRHITFVLQTIDDLLEVSLDTLQKLFLLNGLERPKLVVSDIDSLPAYKLVTDAKLRLDSLLPIQDVVAMNLLIHHANYAVQGVMELDLPHAIVNWDLQTAQEFPHEALHSPLTQPVPLDLLEVASVILVIKQASLPLCIVQ